MAVWQPTHFAGLKASFTYLVGDLIDLGPPLLWAPVMGPAGCGSKNCNLHAGERTRPARVI